MTVSGDERSLRYAFSVVTGKGVCSSDSAVARLSRYAHMSGTEVQGGERGQSVLPVQKMIIGPLQRQMGYDSFSFTFAEMESFAAFLRANGASCSVVSYGAADDFPELEIRFDGVLLDKLGVTAGE